MLDYVSRWRRVMVKISLNFVQYLLIRFTLMWYLRNTEVDPLCFKKEESQASLAGSCI